MILCHECLYWDEKKVQATHILYGYRPACNDCRERNEDAIKCFSGKLYERLVKELNLKEIK